MTSPTHKLLPVLPTKAERYARAIEEQIAEWDRRRLTASLSAWEAVVTVDAMRELMTERRALLAAPAPSQDSRAHPYHSEMNETLRNEFEAWVRETFGVTSLPRMCVPSTYDEQVVQGMWQAWQGARATAAPQWNPIETAPKDGTNFLVYGIPVGEINDDLEPHPVIGVGQILYGEYISCPHSDAYSVDWRATHWMPLPAPPGEGKEGTDG